MNRTLRTGAAVAAASIALGGMSAGTAHAASTGKIKICAFNLGVGDTVAVAIDGVAFATFPTDGKCEGGKYTRGEHTVTVAPVGTTISRTVVKDKDGKDTIPAGSPITFVVSKKKTSKVNIFFTG